MDKAERKTEKKLVNFRADFETLEYLTELGSRWEMKSQTEVIIRALRETVERGNLEADTRLDEVLDVVRGLPDAEDVKRVVKEAGAELRAEKGTLYAATARDFNAVPAPDRANYLVPPTLDELRESGAISQGPPLNAYCVHCQNKFAGPKGANICSPCARDGHVSAGDCRRCAQKAHAAKLAASPTAAENVDYDWQEPV